VPACCCSLLSLLLSFLLSCALTAINAPAGKETKAVTEQRHWSRQVRHRADSDVCVDETHVIDMWGTL
jgi:hypothetical protein